MAERMALGEEEGEGRGVLERTGEGPVIVVGEERGREGGGVGGVVFRTAR